MLFQLARQTIVCSCSGVETNEIRNHVRNSQVNSNIDQGNIQHVIQMPREYTCRRSQPTSNIPRHTGRFIVMLIPIGSIEPFRHAEVNSAMDLFVVRRSIDAIGKGRPSTCLHSTAHVKRKETCNLARCYTLSKYTLDRRVSLF